MNYSGRNGQALKGKKKRVSLLYVLGTLFSTLSQCRDGPEVDPSIDTQVISAVKASLK